MAKLTFIHANNSFVELRELRTIKSVDIQISQASGADLVDNTFSIVLSEKDWKKNPVLLNHMLYSPGTEWGGVVTNMIHNTKDRTITLQGPTWRGLLYQRRIEPASGNAYREYSNTDALAVVRDIIGESYGSLFTVATGTFGKSVSAKYRYQSYAGGLQSTLRSYKLRLKLSYDNSQNTVEVNVEAVTNQTNAIEISQDYDIPFTSESGNIELANHCLALGSGELTERMVRNVYRVGTTYYPERPSALSADKIRTVILDYPNAESEEELYKSAINRLMEKSSISGITVDEADLGETVNMGDTVLIRDRLTGMAGTAEIVGKILTANNGKQKIQVKLESTGYVWNDNPSAKTWNAVSAYTWREIKQSNWSEYVESD